MIKRLSVALAALFVLATSAFGAGTIPYSLSQQLDEFGKPLSGCKLYIIQAGTVRTPQNAYSDSALTISLGSQLTCTAAGRLPQFFLADGSIKVVLNKSNGVNVVTADGILVVGASGGGGGGSPVDATTILATGDLKPRYGTGVLSGFVRANGRTIGSSTSGASERANADCQSLFEYLWAADANLTVSTGRGGSANADWVANKTITLPDWRGRALAALDDMGSAAAGRLTATYFGATATTLGASGGTESHTLSLLEAPAGIAVSGLNAISVTNSGTITSTGTNSITASGSNSISASGSNSISVNSTVATVHSAGVSDNYTSVAGFGTWNSPTRGTLTSTNASQNITVANAAQNISVANASQNISVSIGAGSVTSAGNNTVTGTSTNTAGSPHAIASPMMLATIYVKL